MEKQQKAPKAPSVVYDLRMPTFHYRDDRGQAKAVCASPPEAKEEKLLVLANFCGAGL